MWEKSADGKQGRHGRSEWERYCERGEGEEWMKKLEKFREGSRIETGVVEGENG